VVVKRRYEADNLTQAAGGDSKAPDREVGDESDPSRMAYLEERKKILWQAINQLPPTEKQAVVLKHIEGESYEVIASMMERSVVAVRGLVLRGRQRIKDILNTQFDTDQSL